MRMTRDEAIEIRSLQLCGKQVDPAAAEEAMLLLKSDPGTLSPHQWHYRRVKAGLVKPRTGPKVQVDLSNPQALDCPCGDEDCDAEPAAVVEAVKPWALLKEGDEPKPATHWQVLRSEP